jgi:hypothetical protein
MATPTDPGRQPTPEDHPLYRIAHLHGSRWVTFKPQEQHSPRGDEPGLPWVDGTVYRCEECDERVVVAAG